MSHATRTSNHTIETWQNRTLKHWSPPHQKVFLALNARGEGRFVTEEPVTGRCTRPGCRHEWLADFLWRRLGFIVEIHLTFKNRKKQASEDETQALRKACLEGEGYKVKQYTATQAKKQTGHVVDEILATLAAMRRVLQERLKK